MPAHPASQGTHVRSSGREKTKAGAIWAHPGVSCALHACCVVFARSKSSNPSALAKLLTSSVLAKSDKVIDCGDRCWLYGLVVFIEQQAKPMLCQLGRDWQNRNTFFTQNEVLTRCSAIKLLISGGNFSLFLHCGSGRARY